MRFRVACTPTLVGLRQRKSAEEAPVRPFLAAFHPQVALRSCAYITLVGVRVHTHARGRLCVQIICASSDASTAAAAANNSAHTTTLSYP